MRLLDKSNAAWWNADSIRFPSPFTQRRKKVKTKTQTNQRELADLREQLLPEEWILLKVRLWIDRNVLAPILFIYFFARRFINPCFEG